MLDIWNHFTNAGNSHESLRGSQFFTFEVKCWGKIVHIKACKKWRHRSTHSCICTRWRCVVSYTPATAVSLPGKYSPVLNKKVSVCAPENVWRFEREICNLYQESIYKIPLLQFAAYSLHRLRPIGFILQYFELWRDKIICRNFIRNHSLDFWIHFPCIKFNVRATFLDC